MSPWPHTAELSEQLRGQIVENWLKGDAGDPAAEARLNACRVASLVIASSVRRQLEEAGYQQPARWRHHRPCVIGYVNAVSDAATKSNGETSRWATALVALPVLLSLAEDGSSEDAACREAQSLWERRDPGYLAGIEAGRLDFAVGDLGAVGRLAEMLANPPLSAAGATVRVPVGRP